MDAKELTDDALMSAIKGVCDFDAERAEKWRPEALAIGRAVERAVLAALAPSDAAQAPIYQARFSHGWLDVDPMDYEDLAGEKRIVYADPVAPKES